VSFKYKSAIYKVMRKLRNITDEDKKEEILNTIYNRLDVILEKYSDNKKYSRIFELFQYEVAKEILK
jgi:hypothetical protein